MSRDCLPGDCALADERHLHCACGLPMAVGARRCELCDREQVSPTLGQPSRRLNRSASMGRFDALIPIVAEILREEER